MMTSVHLKVTTDDELEFSFSMNLAWAVPFQYAVRKKNLLMVVSIFDLMIINNFDSSSLVVRLAAHGVICPRRLATTTHHKCFSQNSIFLCQHDWKQA